MYIAKSCLNGKTPHSTGQFHTKWIDGFYAFESIVFESRIRRTLSVDQKPSILKVERLSHLLTQIHITCDPINTFFGVRESTEY